jgi:hypothetical protein
VRFGIGAGEGDCQGREIAYPHLKVETKPLTTRNYGFLAPLISSIWMRPSCTGSMELAISISLRA